MVGESYRAVVLGADLGERRDYALGGIPTRARVSPSGRMVAWTVLTCGPCPPAADRGSRPWRPATAALAPAVAG
ncbi:hypothetical protein [Frankia sp. QA3]|uniref:hypothetical protein n=1 Tax=Frankia sp. QA3 TaxID=710111 RepID=UPI0002F61B75|nr:hypothetical protein [Frankia sp. QA3]